MKDLFGTHENKLDAKGRVSVPASFRNAWKDVPEMTLIIRPSAVPDCLEVWPEPTYEQFREEVRALPKNTPERLAQETIVFSQAVPAEIDPQGRISIPGDLAEEIGLAASVCFVGRGDYFQIWDPAKAKAFLKVTRAQIHKVAIEAPSS
ncbi:division/cell wall cluster transcriptional repressor MraZ [Acidocella sp.]|uniref:division/cell wall cluster transcriptional repressor MraZ n=1 Tax=Acidocella sp. TaxID=50710 RepID=UPI002622B862|nr:division/cell wall cluster transcriptional repressor MraZ [Acidocella sp.]